MYIAVKSTDLEVANPYYSSNNSRIEPRLIRDTKKDYKIVVDEKDLPGLYEDGYTLYKLSHEVKISKETEYSFRLEAI